MTRDSRRSAGAEPVVFRMRARLFDLGDDYWVETTTGRTLFQVEGKVVRVRDTLIMRDVGGEVVAQMQMRDARIRDSMKIDRPGRPAATVTKATVAPLRERYVVEADDVGTIDVQGNLVDHEYTFESNGRPIGEVSKRWVPVRDSHGVQVEPEADAVLVLAATVAIDAMTD